MEDLMRTLQFARFDILPKGFRCFSQIAYPRVWGPGTDRIFLITLIYKFIQFGLYEHLFSCLVQLDNQ